MNSLIPASVSVDEYHAMQAKNMPEKVFQATIIGAAMRQGWLVYHTFDSRRSQPGFPDLVLVHPEAGKCLFRELKTQTGKTTPKQDEWLTALTHAGLDAAVWRPADWFDNTIDAQLIPGFVS